MLDVSILVLLEPPLIQLVFIWTMKLLLVSILVLLEPPLILVKKILKEIEKEKFQSLFYWNLLSYEKNY